MRHGYASDSKAALAPIEEDEERGIEKERGYRSERGESTSSSSTRYGEEER